MSIKTNIYVAMNECMDEERQMKYKFLQSVTPSVSHHRRHNEDEKEYAHTPVSHIISKQNEARRIK